jgi:hypothetical protein
VWVPRAARPLKKFGFVEGVAGIDAYGIMFDNLVPADARHRVGVLR